MTLGSLLTKEVRRIARKELKGTADRLTKANRQIARLARLVRRQALLLRTLQQPGGQPRRRRLTLSPKRRAALQLQGRYIGHLRMLTPRNKQRVKATRTSKGVLAAIALARKLAPRG